MKNKILSMFLYVFSFILISSSAVFASDLSNVKGLSTSNKTINQSIQKLQVSKLNKNIYLASAFAGGAPQLTSYRVYAILSDKYGEEDIQQGRMTSYNNYDNIPGREEIVTVEYGYGTPTATIGVGHNEVKCVRTDSIDELGRVNVPGLPSVGFIRYWDVSNYKTGMFSSTNTSINSPYTNLYLNFYVQ